MKDVPSLLVLVILLFTSVAWADCSPCKKTGETEIVRKDGSKATVEICDCRDWQKKQQEEQKKPKQDKA